MERHPRAQSSLGPGKLRAEGYKKIVHVQYMQGVIYITLITPRRFIPFRPVLLDSPGQAIKTQDPLATYA